VKGSKIIWTFVFLFVLGLTQLNKYMEFGEADLLGIPFWVWYFILVHIIFIVALYFFSKSFFKEEEL